MFCDVVVPPWIVWIDCKEAKSWKGTERIDGQNVTVAFLFHDYQCASAQAYL